MTVCIGALAAKSKAIVLVADKAITYTSHSSALLQWDVTGLCKIVQIGTSCWYVMLGGDPTFALQVIKTCETDCADNLEVTGCVWKMMDCLAGAYASVRKQRIEESILRPRFLTVDDLIRRDPNLPPLDPTLLQTVNTAVDQFCIDCDLLVCGFDNQKEPHVFLVREPGTSFPYDLEGFSVAC